MSYRSGQAVKVPVNPLYFAIPVTVAASTTLVFPTASFVLAYVYDRLDIGLWDLVRVSNLEQLT